MKKIASLEKRDEEEIRIRENILQLFFFFLHFNSCFFFFRLLFLILIEEEEEEEKSHKKSLNILFFSKPNLNKFLICSTNKDNF